TAWVRVAIRVGADGKVSTPATASGIAGKKPASAADGKGRPWPRPTSMTDQMVSQIAQLNADAASKPHARRIRPLARKDANPQLAAATKAAIASPRSSTSVTDWSPPIRKPIQIVK